VRDVRSDFVLDPDAADGERRSLGEAASLPPARIDR
jgi:hypothetical protein